MLVISRQVGDGIMLGDDIEVAVVSIEPDAVTLRVRRPGAVPESVHRLARDAVIDLNAPASCSLPACFSCTLVDIRGDKVRLGVVAPKEVSVHRKELYDAIRVANSRRNRLERRGLL